MTQRQLLMLGAALLCASALIASRARAMTPADLGPIRLVRPLASSTMERLLDEAESIYRQRNVAQAMDAFRTIVELEPGRLRAWLRIGNLHQQASRLPRALEAYQRAASAEDAPEPDPETVAKALLNIALIGLEQANAAIERLDGEPLSAELQALRNGVADELASTVARIAAPAQGPGAARDAGPRTGRAAGQGERRSPQRTEAPLAGAREVGATVGRRVPPAPAAPAAASPASSPGSSATAGPPAAGPATANPAARSGPYTVDRWIARPSPRPRRSARSTLHEPVTEDPLPARPVIEYIQGAPARSAR